MALQNCTEKIKQHYEILNRHADTIFQNYCNLQYDRQNIIEMGKGILRLCVQEVVLLKTSARIYSFLDYSGKNCSLYHNYKKVNSKKG